MTVPASRHSALFIGCAGCPATARGGPRRDPRLQYFRLHGSPRIYYDAYAQAALRRIKRRLLRPAGKGVQRWCIFDNTALGHASANGLDLLERLGDVAGTG